MELIPIQQKEIDGDIVNSVSAREFQAYLDNKRHFSEWISPYIEANNEYDFNEGIDFLTVHLGVNRINQQVTYDYFLTMDMAKEIAMLSRTKKGKEARRYFIACEKKLKQNVSVFALPKTLSEALQLAADQAKQLELASPKIEAYDRLIGADAIFSVNQTAKLLGWGRNKLFAALRNRKILMDDNLPYQAHIDNGRFIVKDTVIDRGIKSIAVSQTYITTKGQVWLSELFGDDLRIKK